MLQGRIAGRRLGQMVGTQIVHRPLTGLICEKCIKANGFLWYAIVYKVLRLVEYRINGP